VPPLGGPPDEAGACPSATDPATSFPCFKYRFCHHSPVCSCDANGCVANSGPPIGGNTGAFDIAIRDDVADGTAIIPFHGEYTIRLTHVAH
jgi:hypothetical protein